MQIVSEEESQEMQHWVYPLIVTQVPLKDGLKAIIKKFMIKFFLINLRNMIHSKLNTVIKQI